MQVFAADLFVSKFKDDLLNQHAGLRFRNKVIANMPSLHAHLNCYKMFTSLQVLAPGGSKDPLEIITDYLGREPSLQPFIQSRTRNSL
jgi:thimet oligopeptidase